MHFLWCCTKVVKTGSDVQRFIRGVCSRGQTAVVMAKLTLGHKKKKGGRKSKRETEEEGERYGEGEGNRKEKGKGKGKEK